MAAYETSGNVNNQQNDNIKIFLRVKPADSNFNCIKTDPNNPNSIVINQGNRSEEFTYDYVGSSCEQAYVFEKVGKQISDNCLKGYNGTIFA